MSSEKLNCLNLYNSVWISLLLFLIYSVTIWILITCYSGCSDYNGNKTCLVLAHREVTLCWERWPNKLIHMCYLQLWQLHRGNKWGTELEMNEGRQNSLFTGLSEQLAFQFWLKEERNHMKIGKRNIPDGESKTCQHPEVWKNLRI